ncbi:hypothetical protein QJS10_CPA03g01079 [Acorus calamus]|uniref:Mitochondrial carrier protein n=1 Tax=Acorus calamus TaxID=4465 RepID=A0AAV9F8I2_ACOCL|nr:hypothetical protein QJS10_CPA03g01079 [Acorus calamus]
MDVVKQRLQLKSSPYKGVADCIGRVLREEGFGAFYASYRTTVLMNAPFTAVHFATYEASKKALAGGLAGEGEEVEEGFVVHATAGAAAGALAAVVTTPLDVVKTQLQCQVVEQEVCGENFLQFVREEGHVVVVDLLGVVAVQAYFIPLKGVCGCDRFSSSSIKEVFQTILRRDGYAGLMRGWLPRMLFHAPAAAICWSSYEAVKTFFQEFNERRLNT